MEEELEPMAIAVIDSEMLTLKIYNVPDDWDADDVEAYIQKKGHKASNCAWGVFDGTVNDLR